MRPTKEMIIETKQLVNETNRNIKQIVRENNLELTSIRNKDEIGKSINTKLIYGVAIIISLLLSYQMYQFFFSK
jgi:hypothetical protein